MYGLLTVLEKQNLDVISVNIWHILISLCNLLILFLVLKKLLFKPVKKIFDQRAGEVSEIYDKANAAKEEAEKKRAIYEEKLSGADEEAHIILKSAKESADKLSDEIIGGAKSEADSVLTAAREEIALEKKKAMNDIKKEISSISLDIAEKLLFREVNEKDHEKLINSFIDDMQGD